MGSSTENEKKYLHQTKGNLFSFFFRGNIGRSGVYIYISIYLYKYKYTCSINAEKGVRPGISREDGLPRRGPSLSLVAAASELQAAIV